MIAASPQFPLRRRTRSANDGWRRFRLSRVSEIAPYTRLILLAMSAGEYSASDSFAVQLAVGEALVNAIRHGNRNDPRKQVELSFRVGTDGVAVEIADEGRGFDPARTPDPTLPQNWNRAGGRGVHLMRAYMTSVDYAEGGRRVLLRRARGEES